MWPRRLQYSVTRRWQAALGFMMTKSNAATMYARPEYSLPGLDNFYMIGQWVKGLGVPTAAVTGKEVIQRICRADGEKFKAL